MEYTNGTKTTWRYWAWKRLREKIRIQPGLATVLFLSGPSPEDLAAATKNGFKIRNIVAVDINPDAVKAARKAGCVAIEGDIHDVVKFWNDGDIHGVMADYCYGLSFEQFVASYDLMKPVTGPVCFNFQRGRESSDLTSIMRQVFGKYGVSTNRAEQFVFMIALQFWHHEEYQGVTRLDREFLIDALDGNPECVSRNVQFIKQHLTPQYMSYRSNAVMMDSIVLNQFCCGTSDQMREINLRRRQLEKQLLNADITLSERLGKNNREIRKSIAEQSKIVRSMEEDLIYFSERNREIDGEYGDVVMRLNASITEAKKHIEKSEITMKRYANKIQPPKKRRAVISRLNAAKAVRTMNNAARPGDN